MLETSREGHLKSQKHLQNDVNVVQQNKPSTSSSKSKPKSKSKKDTKLVIGGNDEIDETKFHMNEVQNDDYINNLIDGVGKRFE
jgi:hypothetical protein